MQHIPQCWLLAKTKRPYIKVLLFDLLFVVGVLLFFGGRGWKCVWTFFRFYWKQSNIMYISINTNVPFGVCNMCKNMNYAHVCIIDKSPTIYCMPNMYRHHIISRAYICVYNCLNFVIEITKDQVRTPWKLPENKQLSNYCKCRTAHRIVLICIQPWL